MKKSILRTMMVALAMIVAMNANAQGKLNPGADSKGVATTLDGLTAGRYYKNPTTKVVYYISTANGANLTGIAVGLEEDDKTVTSITINGWIQDGNYILITESVANNGTTYSYDFTGLSSVTTLTFSYTEDGGAEYYIKSIPAGAFTALTGLTSVVCESPTPADCDEGAFATTTYSNASLTVPTGDDVRYAYYDSESGWTKFQKFAIQCGDINCDGMIDGRDLSSMIVLVEDEEHPVAYDLNGDGLVDGRDLTKLIGLIEDFGV